MRCINLRAGRGAQLQVARSAILAMSHVGKLARQRRDLKNRWDSVHVWNGGSNGPHQHFTLQHLKIVCSND